MELLISTQGDEAVQRRFSKLAHNTGNATVVFTEISTLLAETNEKSWGRGVKLAESTLEQKAQDGTAPLVKTGRLKESLTSKTGAGEAIRIITPTEMVFGTKVFYARWVNYGFEHVGGERVPKRKVLKLTPKARKTVKALLANHIMGRA